MGGVSIHASTKDLPMKMPESSLSPDMSKVKVVINSLFDQKQDHQSLSLLRQSIYNDRKVLVDGSTSNMPKQRLKSAQIFKT